MGTVPPLPSTQGTRYPGYTVPTHHPSGTGTPTEPRRVHAPRRPGLNGLLLPRVGGCHKRACALVFTYPRSIWPGTQDHLQVVLGKCWIASRSRWIQAGQARMAWPGHPSDPDPADPRSTLRILGSGPRKTDFSRIPTKQNGEYFCRFGRPGKPGKQSLFGLFRNPEHTVIREIARTGSGRFWAQNRHLGTCARNRAFPGFLAELIAGVG